MNYCLVDWENCSSLLVGKCVFLRQLLSDYQSLSVCNCVCVCVCVCDVTHHL
uniref:Uncharacterized protein n=1 Tax=Anguilla anguilla TaxID=7936 RepID=A0A0E9WNB9_ANGAN